MAGLVKLPKIVKIAAPVAFNPVNPFNIPKEVLVPNPKPFETKTILPETTRVSLPPQQVPPKKNKPEALCTTTGNRKAELQLTELLKSSENVLIGIHGPTGCGKTSLIKNVAAKLSLDIVHVNTLLDDFLCNRKRKVSKEKKVVMECGHWTASHIWPLLRKDAKHINQMMNTQVSGGKVILLEDVDSLENSDPRLRQSIQSLANYVRDVNNGKHAERAAKRRKHFHDKKESNQQPSESKVEDELPKVSLWPIIITTSNAGNKTYQKFFPSLSMKEKKINKKRAHTETTTVIIRKCSIPMYIPWPNERRVFVGRWLTTYAPGHTIQAPVVDRILTEANNLHDIVRYLQSHLLVPLTKDDVYSPGTVGTLSIHGLLKMLFVTVGDLPKSADHLPVMVAQTGFDMYLFHLWVHENMIDYLPMFVRPTPDPKALFMLPIPMTYEGKVNAELPADVDFGYSTVADMYSDADIFCKQPEYGLDELSHHICTWSIPMLTTRHNQLVFQKEGSNPVFRFPKDDLASTKVRKSKVDLDYRILNGQQEMLAQIWPKDVADNAKRRVFGTQVPSDGLSEFAQPMQFKLTRK